MLGHPAPVTAPSRRRSQEPRRAAVAAQRACIMAAFVACASEWGYAGTSVKAVVERAGVSRRKFYEHFRGKEDLFVQICADPELAARLGAPATEPDRTPRALSLP